MSRAISSRWVPRRNCSGSLARDDAADKLQTLLCDKKIGCPGLVKSTARHTSIKTRIVAHQQQVVRVDRETRGAVDGKTAYQASSREIKKAIAKADAVIIGDYGKGVVTQPCCSTRSKACATNEVSG